MCTINFTVDNIEKIIASLNANKAHGHDNISIRMLKVCGHTICKPLELIFKQVLTTGVFPSEWKKGNIVPCYKKGNKQNLQNYRPVFLLPICEKFFERLIFNEMFSFFVANSLLVPNQSGLNQVTLVLSSFYQLLKRFIHLLMLDLKLEVFSWIYLKPSIKSGMKGLYLNFSKTVFRMTC